MHTSIEVVIEVSRQSMQKPFIFHALHLSYINLKVSSRDSLT